VRAQLEPSQASLGYQTLRSTRSAGSIGYQCPGGAGKPVKKVLLREVQVDAGLNEVRIVGSSLQSLPAEVVAAREKAKAEAKQRKVAPILEPAATSSPSQSRR